MKQYILTPFLSCLLVTPALAYSSDVYVGEKNVVYPKFKVVTILLVGEPTPEGYTLSDFEKYQNWHWPRDWTPGPTSKNTHPKCTVPFCMEILATILGYLRKLGFIWPKNGYRLSSQF